MCVCPQGCRLEAQKTTVRNPAWEASVQSFCCVLKTWYTFLPTSPYACFLVEAGRDPTPPPQTGSRLCPLLSIYIFPLGDRQMGQWTEPQTDS